MLILADHKLSQSVAYKGKAEGWNGFICLDERKCISFTTDLCFVLWCIQQLNFALTMKIAQL